MGHLTFLFAVVLRQATRPSVPASPAFAFGIAPSLTVVARDGDSITSFDGRAHAVS